MVILIGGVSFIGCIAIKLIGERQGILAAALAGGPVSSTAVTMNLAGRAKRMPDQDDEVLKLPLTVLSRSSERWTVFLEKCGRLCLRHPSLCCHFVRSWASLKGRFRIIPQLHI